jgi:hypothetical protein
MGLFRSREKPPHNAGANHDPFADTEVGFTLDVPPGFH